jgi:hypothetical protein
LTTGAFKVLAATSLRAKCTSLSTRSCICQRILVSSVELTTGDLKFLIVTGFRFTVLSSVLIYGTLRVYVRSAK